MTNGIYFFNTIREEWSSSTSPNETPRAGFVDAGNPTLVEEASSSSSGPIVGGGSSISPTQIPPGDDGKLGSSNLISSRFKKLKVATSEFKHDGGDGGFGSLYKGDSKEFKQKLVMKMSMVDAKSRIRAMKIVISTPGVIATALQGADRNQIEVLGTSIDPVFLIVLLRKKVGFTELVSVTAMPEKKVGFTELVSVTAMPEKKVEKKKRNMYFCNPLFESLPACCGTGYYSDTPNHNHSCTIV